MYLITKESERASELSKVKRAMTKSELKVKRGATRLGGRWPDVGRSGIGGGWVFVVNGRLGGKGDRRVRQGAV